jgi:hypothetical protein
MTIETTKQIKFAQYVNTLMSHTFAPLCSDLTDNEAESYLENFNNRKNVLEQQYSECYANDPNLTASLWNMFTPDWMSDRPIPSEQENYCFREENATLLSVIEEMKRGTWEE